MRRYGIVIILTMYERLLVVKDKVKVEWFKEKKKRQKKVRVSAMLNKLVYIIDAVYQSVVRVNLCRCFAGEGLLLGFDFIFNLVS